MPKLNVDHLFEPITFQVGDQTYTCRELTVALLDELTAMEQEREADDFSVEDLLNRQLALLTGAAPEEFSALSLRARAGLVKAIIGETTTPSGGAAAKNARTK